MDVLIGLLLGDIYLVLAAAAIALVVFAVVASLLRTRQRLQRRPLDAFYDPPFDLPAGVSAEPGAVVRHEPVPGARAGTAAHRLVYLSAGETGALVPVSAIALVPAGRPIPPGGWPVVTICHGTVGLGRDAAPSLTALDPPHIPRIPRELLGSVAATAGPFAEAGYATIATDYTGLGVDGPPSYMIGAIEARNALDAVRALRRSGIVPVANQTFAWGHSEGGHAAAFVRQLAPQYAPDIPISGTVLVAPAINLQALFDGLIRADAAGPLTALIMVVISAWSRYYPDADAARVMTPLGLDGLPSVATGGAMAVVNRWRQYRPTDVIVPNLLDDPAWARLVALNTPDTAAVPGPLLVIQGLADQIIAPATTEAFIEAWRAAGNDVTLTTLPGKTHFTAQDASVPEQVAWVDKLRGPGQAPPLT